MLPAATIPAGEHPVGVYPPGAAPAPPPANRKEEGMVTGNLGRVALVALLLVPAGAAQAEDKAAPVDAQALYTQGAGAVLACKDCHGKGMGGESGFPLVNGLNAAYLEKQLNDFRSGARKEPIMAPIAKAMTEAQVTAMARFFSEQARVPDPVPAPDKALLAEGKALATVGAWNQNVPACNDCHGPEGMGVGREFPELTGQYPAYIMKQFQAWANGQRANDPLGLMQAVVKGLNDQQMKAVAAYYGSLKPGGAAPASSQ